MILVSGAHMVVVKAATRLNSTLNTFVIFQNRIKLRYEVRLNTTQQNRPAFLMMC
jgi:hypothetical protein